MMTEEKPVVLVADDNFDNILLINEILKDFYSVRVATDGEKALKVAAKIQPDIILMDVMMPLMDGYETCRRLKQDENLKDIPVLFLTAKADADDEKAGFDLGAADYIAKPVNPSILSARIKTHLNLKKARDRLKDQNSFLNEEVNRRMKDISTIQEASIMAMAALAETRDNETGHHLRRTKLYIKCLGEYLGGSDKYKDVLTPKTISLITVSSPLHDIGKIGIPDYILLKPGPLTKEEYEIMKTHTAIGKESILSAEKLIGGAETFLTCAREIAYSHHEKWDGSGYPLGLKGEDIPLPARLMAIVDAYDALTSKRVYKEAVSHSKAVGIIKADTGTHFDPEIAEAFFDLQDRFYCISERHKDLASAMLPLVNAAF
ncbi:two-component system response regulator [Bacillota bacterium]